MSPAHSIYSERPAEPDENPQKPERPEIAPPDYPTIPQRATPDLPEIFPPNVPGIEPRPDDPEINPS
jgi:hypothetical protein